MQLVVLCIVANVHHPQITVFDKSLSTCSSEYLVEFKWTRLSLLQSNHSFANLLLWASFPLTRHDGAVNGDVVRKLHYCTNQVHAVHVLMNGLMKTTTYTSDRPKKLSFRISEDLLHRVQENKYILRLFGLRKSNWGKNPASSDCKMGIKIPLSFLRLLLRSMPEMLSKSLSIPKVGGLISMLIWFMRLWDFLSKCWGGAILQWFLLFWSNCKRSCRDVYGMIKQLHQCFL